jgi:hypothetical protein
MLVWRIRYANGEPTPVNLQQASSTATAVAMTSNKPILNDPVNNADPLLDEQSHPDIAGQGVGIPLSSAERTELMNILSQMSGMLGGQ